MKKKFKRWFRKQNQSVQAALLTIYCLVPFFVTITALEIAQRVAGNPGKVIVGLIILIICTYKVIKIILENKQ